MNRRTGLTIVATAVGTIVVLAIAVALFIRSGVYNIAATEPHIGIVRGALNTLQEQSVRARADEVPPPPPIDAAMIRHGAEHYAEMCVVCHGAPGAERGEFGQGMRPPPPRLERAVPRWSDRELFWIVRNGLKFAGMPAFGPSHSDEEIWGIVGFVRGLPGMQPEEYRRLTAAVAPGPPGHHADPDPRAHDAAPDHADHEHDDGHTH